MTPPEVTATPDELAAVYLRARDVPCPGCGYNRRGGAVAACPECEHDLLVRDGTPLESHAQLRDLRRIASIILVAVGLSIAGNLFNLGRTALLMSQSGMPWSTLLPSVIWVVLNLLFGLIAIVLARKAARALRPSPADTGRALRLLMLSVLASLATGILSLPAAVMFALLL